MLRFLSDENFNGDAVRGLQLRLPDIDLVRVQDVGLAGVEDDEVLAWAAVNDRIILTHDRATMPDFAFARVTDGQTMPGVFVLNDRLSVRQIIDAILLVDACSNQSEWAGLVMHLPF